MFIIFHNLILIAFQLLFDVSVYQFFRESYQAASQNFIMCHSRYQDWQREEAIKKSHESAKTDSVTSKMCFCHVKEDELNGYIAASKSLTLDTPGLTLTQRFLASCRDNYMVLLLLFLFCFIFLNHVYYPIYLFMVGIEFRQVVQTAGMWF